MYMAVSQEGGMLEDVFSIPKSDQLRLICLRELR